MAVLKYSGAAVAAYTVSAPAPLGRASPQRHADAVTPVERDDAPETTRISTPDFFAEVDIWSTPETVVDGSPAEVRRGHDAEGSHDLDTQAIPPAPATMDDASAVPVGGLAWDGPVEGAGGAAHGGLRADNSMAWANPDGFDPGHGYTPRQSNRRMGSWGFFRGTLRPVPEPGPQPGTVSSPAQTRGRHTSPFDPVAIVSRFGPQRPTQRRNLMPAGDGVTDADMPGATRVDYDVEGSEYQL
jgi:hypothetical protein